MAQDTSTATWKIEDNGALPSLFWGKQFSS